MEALPLCLWNILTFLAPIIQALETPYFNFFPQILKLGFRKKIVHTYFWLAEGNCQEGCSSNENLNLWAIWEANRAIVKAVCAMEMEPCWPSFLFNFEGSSRNEKMFLVWWISLFAQFWAKQPTASWLKKIVQSLSLAYHLAPVWQHCMESIAILERLGSAFWGSFDFLISSLNLSRCFSKPTKIHVWGNQNPSSSNSNPSITAQREFGWWHCLKTENKC